MHLIQDNEALARWAEQWRREPCIGLDTEFVRTQTYYPKVGLIQIATQQATFLIDPLAIDDFTPLRELLADPNLVKVLHACGEDLEVFQLVLGQLPRPLFDTQVAAAFAGLGLSVGFQSLVESELNGSLPPSETRSDWLARPLSPSQLAYASADVYYLIPLYRNLSDRLRAKGMEQACLEECEQLLQEFERGRRPEDYYLKLRAAWRLRRHQQGILRSLCAWREYRAQERDLPRGRVLADATLIDIASKRPRNMGELSRVEGISPQQIRRDGEAILQLLREAQIRKDPERGSQEPEIREREAEAFERIAPPLVGPRKELFQRLRARVRAIAENLGLPDSLLMKKGRLESLAGSVDLSRPLAQLPMSIEGWRGEHLAVPLLSELNAFIEEYGSDATGIHLQESP